MKKTSDDQSRYLGLLADWKGCKTNTTFKEYVLSCGYGEDYYNKMMLKYGTGEK
jgi:hypothetical protein